MQVLDGKGAFPSDRSSNGKTVTAIYLTPFAYILSENASTTDSESDKGACMPSDSESDKGECMHSDSESEDLQDCILHCDSLFEQVAFMHSATFVISMIILYFQNQHKEIRDYLKRLQLPASQDLDAVGLLLRLLSLLYYKLYSYGDSRAHATI